MKGRDIIVCGQQSWDSKIGANIKNIAIEFSKNNRVLFINAPLDRKSKYSKSTEDEVIYRKKVLSGEIPDLVEEKTNLHILTPKTTLESINFLPKGYLHHAFLLINSRRMAKYILNAVRILNFKNFLLFDDSDMFRGFYYKELLEPKGFFYYSRDNLLATPYFGKHGPYYEPKIMKKADAVFCNSTYLRDLALKHNPNSHFVGQGVNLDNYTIKDYACPNDLLNIKGPKILYTGFITTLRLDINLIRFLAQKNPDWSIVLVGPQDDDFKNSDLHQISNIHFLGGKKPEELAAYVWNADVCINPQILNDLTIGNYPLKIDEYLALGKSTVATYTPAMEMFLPHVSLAKTFEEWELAIKNSLTNKNDSESKIAFARTHTWENSINQMYEIMKKY